MNKHSIIRQLRESKRLPSPSRVTLEVIRLSQSETTSMADITRVIETDPALAGELLKYANSSLLGNGPPVVSIHRAATRLGLNNVVNLALGFSLLSRNQAGNCRNFDYPRFWSRSLAQAVAARSIAEIQGKHDPEELFVCGLLSHVGELALASVYPVEYGKILEQETEPDRLEARETEAFGFNHNDVTAELLLDWGIPGDYAQAVGLQKQYGQKSFSGHQTAELGGLLHLACQIADICLLKLPNTGTLLSVEALARRFAITTDNFSTFFDRIVLRWQEFSEMFHIPSQRCLPYEQIKVLGTAVAGEDLDPTIEGLKILVADDDPMTRLNLEKILAAPNRTILIASDGEEALRIAIEQLPQMIITDWKMPVLDGLDLCKFLRRTSLTQHIFFIMLTGCEDDDALVQAFDAGVDDYVVKPFTPRVLEARIRSGERLIRYQKTITRDKELIQRYATSLAAANSKLLTMAMTDALTGLPNRRSMMTRMSEAIAEAKRFDAQLSCIMIDVDHFKTVNDSYGHDSGDLVLKQIAEIFVGKTRGYDMVSRTGGEEFLVISSRTDLESARRLAENLRTAVETHEFTLPGGNIIKLTISLGVAAWQPDFADGNMLIKVADQALYLAKVNGRNRVETNAT